MTLASFEVDPHDDVVVARVEGEIDTSNAEALERDLTDAVPNSALGLVADLSGVRYLDSAGVRLVFALGRRLRMRRQELWLVVPDGSLVRRVLTLTKVDATLPVVTSAHEAVRGIRAAG